MRSEVSFDLGIFDLVIEVTSSDSVGGPSVVIYQSVNGGEYHTELLQVGGLNITAGLKCHHWDWTPAGRLQFMATAGMLSHVVNATSDERDGFAKILSAILGRLESESIPGGKNA